MNKLFIAVMAVSVLFSSCARKVRISDIVDSKRFELLALDFDYLDSRARIKFDDGKKKIALNANIRIKKDSVIWISFSPMLGIEVVRALITRDSLSLLDRINQEYMTMDFVSLSREFNFSLNYDLVQSFILGELPWETTFSDKFRRTKDQYLLKQEVGRILVENYIGQETMKLERIQMMEAVTRNNLTCSYDNFQPVDRKKIFPYSSDMVLNYYNFNKQFTTSINIDHSRVEMDEKNELTFPFNIPERYARK